jgi:two-component SAPR family response regulator
VERAGAPVPLGEWRSAKARELLFYLLCHPAGRTREQIGVALWPEASAEQLRSALHPVLHHLRRVLGDHGAVVHDGGVYRFAAPRYEFDADAMERHLADAARAGADREAAAAALARAVALYGGDFLEQDPPAGDWHVARQDALRRRHDEALGRLGALCLELGRHAEAADAFGRLLARDPLDEAAARGLMRARAGAGDRREVARAYRRLADALRAELGAEPDAETTALFERLQGGAAA